MFFIVFFSFLAPLLSFLNATGQSDNSLKVEWILEYTGGSHDVHMMLSIQSNQLKRRRRSFDPVTYSFNVGVNDNVLVTPTLPFGRRYNVMSLVSSEYGTHQLATTGQKKTLKYFYLIFFFSLAFIGIQDTLSCPFSLSPEDSCGWTVQEPAGSLTLASTVSSPRPTSDARGDSDGVYVLGSIPNDASLETLTLLAYPSISYICSISFYYQLRENVRLRLESSQSQNESLIWASSNGDHTHWTHVQIPPEDFPLSVSTASLLFTMETVDTPSPELSFAAIDDVGLTFCLPCNYTKLTQGKIKMVMLLFYYRFYFIIDSISLSYKNSSIIYIRKDQNITIEASNMRECGQFNLYSFRLQLLIALIQLYSTGYNQVIGLLFILFIFLLLVVPNELLERVVLPDQRKGVISISDITTDIAEAGTTGYIIVSKIWLQNHSNFLLHFLIHIDVLMLCSKFELIPTSIFQVRTILRKLQKSDTIAHGFFQKMALKSLQIFITFSDTC